MSSLASPRGIRDLLPEEAQKFSEVEKSFMEICHLWGYQEVRLPMVEYEQLFLRTIGPGSEIVQKQMYVFESKSGKKLALRPEGTASCVRAYIANHLWQKESMTRWFYTGPMLRYERPQRGRERQFYQCGVECFGSASPAVEGELIAMSQALLQKVYPEPYEIFIGSVGCPHCRPRYEEALRKALEPKLASFCEDCHVRYRSSVLRILDCKNPSCQELVPLLPQPLSFLCPGCQEHRKELFELLTSLKIPFTENPLLVRGLDYYTHTTFELVGKDSLTLIGGGRYNTLVKEMGGENIPAAGFAAGIDRIVLALSQRKGGVSIWILPLEKKFLPRSFEVAERLRKEKISCYLDLSEKKVTTRVKWASRKADYLIFLGAEEVAQEKITLKNVKKEEQEMLALKEAVEKIKKEASREK